MSAHSKKRSTFFSARNFWDNDFSNLVQRRLATEIDRCECIENSDIHQVSQEFVRKFLNGKRRGDRVVKVVGDFLSLRSSNPRLNTPASDGVRGQADGIRDQANP